VVILFVVISHQVVRPILYPRSSISTRFASHNPQFFSIYISSLFIYFRTFSFSVSRNPFVCHFHEHCRVCTNNSHSGTHPSAAHPPFFSITYAQPILQPFCFDGLPSNGGYPPSSRLPCSNLRTFKVLPTYPLCLQTLAHSFAPCENSTLFFSIDSTLFAKNTRGVGYPRSPFWNSPVRSPQAKPNATYDFPPVTSHQPRVTSHESPVTTSHQPPSCPAVSGRSTMSRLHTEEGTRHGDCRTDSPRFRVHQRAFY
jgi:hypothetical protein